MMTLLIWEWCHGTMKRALALGLVLNYLNSTSMCEMYFDCTCMGWIQVVGPFLPGCMERLSGEDIIHLDEFLGASHPCLHTHLLAGCCFAKACMGHHHSWFIPSIWLKGDVRQRPDMKANKGHNTCMYCIICMWMGGVPIMTDVEPWMFTPKRLNAKTVALLKEKKKHVHIILLRSWIPRVFRSIYTACMQRMWTDEKYYNDIILIGESVFLITCRW